ncbi:MAG: FkbM family methyltransferase [Gammaproteobacteria bacterium]
MSFRAPNHLGKNIPVYSSVGFLSPEVDNAHPSIPRFLKRTIRRIAEGARRPPPRLIVETTSIDTEFTVGEPIDFMKIDVQGGETRVLLGADGMLGTRRINLLYIEWSGDPGVVRALSHHGYRIYDSTYMAIPRILGVKTFKKMGAGYPLNASRYYMLWSLWSESGEGQWCTHNVVGTCLKWIAH